MHFDIKSACLSKYDIERANSFEIGDFGSFSKFCEFHYFFSGNLNFPLYPSPEWIGSLCSSPLVLVPCPSPLVLWTSSRRSGRAGAPPAASPPALPAAGADAAGSPGRRRRAAPPGRRPPQVRRPRPPVAAGGPRPPPSRPPRSHFPCFRKALNDSFYRSILLLVDRWPQNSINLLLPSIGDQNPLHHNL